MSEQRNSSYAFRQKRERLLAQPDACCVVCGATAEQTQLHIDHVYPYALAKAAGWTDEEIDADSNLAVMCQLHNLQKGKRVVTHQRAEYFNPRYFPQ